MTKFEYMVEAEINSNWVHAHCATLDEAINLAKALELLADIQAVNQSETVFDVEVYAAKDASETACKAVAEYHKRSALEMLQQELA